MESTILIRFARHDDEHAVFRLAALDSARPLTGDGVIVAELDSQIVAAYDPAADRVVADPFRRTAWVVDLLRMRADQVAGTLSAPREPAHARGVSAYA